MIKRVILALVFGLILTVLSIAFIHLPKPPIVSPPSSSTSSGNDIVNCPEESQNLPQPSNGSGFPLNAQEYYLGVCDFYQPEFINKNLIADYLFWGILGLGIAYVPGVYSRHKKLRSKS